MLKYTAGPPRSNVKPWWYAIAVAVILVGIWVVTRALGSDTRSSGSNAPAVSEIQK
jgi:hypothetical protein